MNISNKTDRIFDDESMELFKTLFDEFVPAFLKTAKGQKHFKTILQSRNEIQNNIEMVRKAYDQGEDITEMVLEKLLPHMDTEHNQVRGAWVHIAPAITKDIKIWFGNIPYYKEKQWSVMAKAVYHFILQCIEHPESLEQACKTFSELPDTKGIQSGFLSPALNALDPDNFITINQKPVRMINHFARTSYSSNLLDYPAINRVGLRMLAELTQMISPVTPQGLHNSDVFDMFSHWLKAVKKFWKGGDNSHSKYWQIAPGKQARLWEEFRNASIAAIGYQKMDFDLSGKSEQELYEIYKEKYKNEQTERSMKLNFKMLWNFINLKLGDKLVTNKGRTLLLGVGEVTRGYQFMPDRSEYQHTVGVNYYKVCDSDTNLPVNLRGKFGKTITPLKEAEFLELEGMIQGSGNNEGYLMLSFKDGSPWDDEFGKSYHYGTNVHNYKKVNTGSRFLLYTKDMGFVGHGVVGDIKTESPDDGSTQFLRANYELFVPIDPPKQLDDEIKNKLKALENYNVRYSIKVVTKEIFDMVLDRDGGEPDKEKWINVKDKLSFQSLGEDFNIDTLHFQDTEKTFIIRRIKTELKNGKHIILIGPPGTGKSKLAKIICESYCGGDNYIMSAATSDWSTFETIGGYRPNEAGRLNFYPGIFLQCFRNYDNSLINKWLIIDEINRADIDKAFGSLFSALTGDDITLPYEVYREQLKVIGKPTDETVITDNLFIVPPDWRIIATMNTFDKASLYEMSYAFMRRFAFVPVDVPKLVTPDLLKEYVNIWGFEIIDEICSNISEIWKTINKRRKVGPAIIKDIYAYIINTEPYDYVSSIIMYVLPQFEGLMEDDQVEFIKEIKSLGIIGNTEELRNFSSEFFGVDIRKFD